MYLFLLVRTPGRGRTASGWSDHSVRGELLARKYQLKTVEAACFRTDTVRLCKCRMQCFCTSGAAGTATDEFSMCVFIRK